MNSTKCINNSALKLNKDELKIIPLKRKKTNLNSNYKKEEILNNPIKKPNRKSKSLNNIDFKIKEALKKQEIKYKNKKKHITSKTLHKNLLNFFDLK